MSIGGAMGDEKMARLRKNGRYYLKGNYRGQRSVSVGIRRKYIDPCY